MFWSKGRRHGGREGGWMTSVSCRFTLGRRPAFPRTFETCSFTSPGLAFPARASSGIQRRCRSPSTSACCCHRSSEHDPTSLGLPLPFCFPQNMFAPLPKDWSLHTALPHCTVCSETPSRNSQSMQTSLRPSSPPEVPSQCVIWVLLFFSILDTTEDLVTRNANPGISSIFLPLAMPLQNIRQQRLHMLTVDLPLGPNTQLLPFNRLQFFVRQSDHHSRIPLRQYGHQSRITVFEHAPPRQITVHNHMFYQHYKTCVSLARGRHTEPLHQKYAGIMLPGKTRCPAVGWGTRTPAYDCRAPQTYRPSTCNVRTAPAEFLKVGREGVSHNDMKRQGRLGSG